MGREREEIWILSRYGRMGTRATSKEEWRRGSTVWTKQSHVWEGYRDNDTYGVT